jgi:hypothetical protein
MPFVVRALAVCAAAQTRLNDARRWSLLTDAEATLADRKRTFF